MPSKRGCCRTGSSCSATRGPSTTRRAAGAPVVEPLALSVGPGFARLRPGADRPRPHVHARRRGEVDNRLRPAASAGMGIRLPVDADDLRLGFDRLIVLGVKRPWTPGQPPSSWPRCSMPTTTPEASPSWRRGPDQQHPGTPAAYPPADPNGSRSMGRRTRRAAGHRPGVRSPNSPCPRLPVACSPMWKAPT